MKYKAGDKILIRSKEWYDKYKDKHGEVRGAFFDKECTILCGSIQTITSGAILGSGIIIYSIEPSYKFIGEEAIEGLVEEDNIFDDTIPLPDSFVERIAHKIADSELFRKEPLDIPTMTTDFVKEHGLPCPNGYIFKDENGNVINATKIVLEKKKNEYPKTYEECCGIMGFCSDTLKWDNPFCINRDTHPYIKHLDNLMERFCKLLICRDAYWKIAGEEMGLGKPWEPDYDSGVDKFGVICLNGIIQKSNPTTNWERHLNKVLDFPTRKMRDAFYENFDPDIESCKELL